jgi:hypothetical protein
MKHLLKYSGIFDISKWGSSWKLNNYLGETRQTNEPSGLFNSSILDEVWSLIAYMDVTCWEREPWGWMNGWMDGWIVMASWSLMAPYGCYMLSERLEDGWIVVSGKDSERVLLFRRMIFLSFFLSLPIRRYLPKFQSMEVKTMSWIGWS